MDDFDIDKFLNENFDKIEKKEKKAKEKKLNSVVSKYNPNTNNKTELNANKSLNINNVIINTNIDQPMQVEKLQFNFENTIDNQIYEGLNINPSNITKNVKENKMNNNLNDVLLPLFPNEKVYKNEFNSEKIFLLDKFIDK